MTDQAASDSREEEKSFDDYFDEFAGLNDNDGESQENESQESDDESENGEEESQLTQFDDKDRLLQDYQAEIESLRREKDELEHSFNSQKGRVSALQKKIDAEKKDEQKPENGQSVDDEDLNEALQLYPEIVTPLLKVFEKERAKLHEEFNQQLAPIHQQEQERYINYQVATLDNKYPEWRDVVGSREYAEWLGSQHEAVQQLSKSIHAKDYEYLLSSFANTRSQKATDISQRRQQQLAANVSVQSRGPSKLSSAPDDFDSAWDFYANKKR